MDYSQAEEQVIIRACRQGNNAAWEELVNRFTPLAYRIAYRMLNHSADAADVTQETFERVFQSLDSFDGSKTFSPWVSKITYHLCLKRLQQVMVRQTDSIDEKPELLSHLENQVSMVAESGSPEKLHSHHVDLTLLREALERLSAQDRALLHLRYKNNFSDSELGEVTGMPVNTIKTRIFRARAFLKDTLAPLLHKK